jgi:hypothetical protein
VLACSASPAAAASPRALSGSVGASVAGAHVRADGRVVVTLRVQSADVREALARRLDPRAGRNTVRLSAGAASRTFALPRRVPGARFTWTARIVLGPAASAAARRSGRVRAAVRLVQTLRLGGPGTLSDRSTASASRTVAVGSAPPGAAAPVCERLPGVVNFATPARLAITCVGEGLSVRISRRPAHGTLRAVRTGPTTTFTYAPKARFVGRDRIAIRAASASGAVVLASQPLVVQPFTFRAIGDSATAGFGYLGNGTQWSVLSLLSCRPPDPENDRCSSNSPNGVGSTGPVGWLPDFGFSNQVAWSAQWAKSAGLSASQFANYGVTGSEPEDWDTGGDLNSILGQVVDDAPDLTAMTLGANPLLDTFLTGSGIECAATFSDAKLIACVNRFIAGVRLTARLRSVIAQLLQAPNNHVVVSQYHLAVPSVSVFSAHQVDVLFQTFNTAVAGAVQGAPGFGTRLFLMSPPRFDIGRAPGSSICPGRVGVLVDGPSRQSRATQDVLAVNPFYSFCGSKIYWVISNDTGIHASRLGHTQYAQALQQVVSAHGLLPPGA